MVERGSPPFTDAQLVQRIGAGERDALDELYRRHAPWLTARLTRRCRDRELVDTAIQDTFLDVWKNAAKYRPSGEVGAWIWTIGVRRLIDQLRKRKPPTPTDDERVFMAVIAEELPLALADTDLGAVFARLAPDLQAVLAAVAFCGLSTREAAGILGIPQGTVKTRLKRAREMMKEMM